MNNLAARWLIVFYILISIMGCNLDTGHYPIEPSISMKSAEGKWTYDATSQSWIRMLKLHFYVIDGDGDIGYTIGDTGTNFFMDMYRIKNNQFIKDSAFNATIPAPDDLGQDKTLKADIYVDQKHFYLPFDTVYYQFYIIDRAGHQSNTLVTDTIVFGPFQN